MTFWSLKTLASDDFDASRLTERQQMALISAQSDASQNPLLHSPFRIDRIIASESIKTPLKRAQKETPGKNILPDVKTHASNPVGDIINTFQPPKGIQVPSHSEMVLARYCERVKALQGKKSTSLLNV